LKMPYSKFQTYEYLVFSTVYCNSRPSWKIHSCFLGTVRSNEYCHMLEWLSTGFWIGFIDHFNTWLVTALNYSAIADLHTWQITTAHTKSFQSSFTNHFLVTDLKNGDSSTALTKSSFHSFPYNWQLTTDLSQF
jgi:hypothetical protein